MARAKGTAIFAVNFEPTGQSALDARLVVDSLADLYTAYDDANNFYPYMVVTVGDEQAQYMLINPTSKGTADGWKRVDAGGAKQVEIVDNLTSGGSDKALSAEQGKVLKGLVDAKLDSLTAGDGIELTGTDTAPIVSAKVDSTSESFLTVSSNGIKLAGVQTAIDTAKNAAIDIANDKVASVSAANGITIGGTATAPTVGAKIDTASESFLSVGAEGIKLSGVQVAITAAQTAATQVANSKVASVKSGNAGIVIGGTDTEPTAGIKLSAGAGNAASLAVDGLMVTVPVVTPYTGKDAVTVTDHEIALKINAADKVLAQGATGLLATIGLSYDSASKSIQLTGNDDEVIASVDATPFIKDGMLEDVSLEVDPEGQPAGTYLKFTFNTESGKEVIFVNVTSLIDVYVAGNGLSLAGKTFSVVIDPASEGFLTVGTAGIKITGIQAAINTAKQAAIDAAAADATTKSNAALSDAKSYTDTQISAAKTELTAAAIKKYSQTIAASTASPQNILASTHKCGTNPMIQCYLGTSLVDLQVDVAENGDVTLSWNGTLSAALKVVMLGN